MRISSRLFSTRMSLLFCTALLAARCSLAFVVPTQTTTTAAPLTTRPQPGGVSTQLTATMEDSSSSSMSSETEKEAVPPSQLTHKIISQLKFRELKQYLQSHDKAVEGTTSQLRSRLRNMVFPEDECIVRNDDVEECGPDVLLDEGITFVDKSDPIQELISDIELKCKDGHWKSATRKLKKLSRKFPEYVIGEKLYLQVLQCCSLNRLQAARASEPARKVMEQLVESGFQVPNELGNHCVSNCLGSDEHSTHQGFGGVDTALAMLSAMEVDQISVDTYSKVILALAKDGSVVEAIQQLQTLIVEKTETPSLEFFADLMEVSVKQPEACVTILNYVKASGYDLDRIANTEGGRRILASAIVAAQASNQDALGLRLLTAASKSGEGNDKLVANLNAAVQRASFLLHKNSIDKSIQNDQWTLAVKLLELMLQRNLRPSPWIWRNVVAICAKNSKSRRATAVLLDWVRLYEAGLAEKPVLSAFNSCINACEICDEHDLTLMVLDSMKKTHDTEGNLITFNIALKRLAKQGNYDACEAIILGMLKAAVEPSVVSYTTAIAACASAETKAPKVAYEWIRRMRSRNVQPNVITYNTALAACNDGTLEGSFLGSKLATEMLNDVEKQLAEDNAEEDELDVYKNVIPDAATKDIARKLMKQLKQNWDDKKIEKRVATDTVRRPYLLLVDFQKSDMASRAMEMAKRRKASGVTRAELELEHRIAEV